MNVPGTTAAQAEEPPGDDGPASSRATLQHIQLLNRRITKLTEAREQAEEQLLHRAAASYRSGEMSLSNLIELYWHYQEAGSPGKSRRWNAHFDLTYQAMGMLPAPNGPEESWVGEWPLSEGAPCAIRGLAVVYVLFDAENAPCYVGSTGKLRTRLSQHARSGKQFTYWQAHPCRDREHAYQLEEQLLRQHMPYLNRRAGR